MSLSVLTLPEAVPRTIVTSVPLSEIVDPLKVAVLSVKSLLSATLPIVAPLTERLSISALFAIETGCRRRR